MARFPKDPQGDAEMNGRQPAAEITKREAIAMHVMAAMCANYFLGSEAHHRLARIATERADELLNELERTKP